ncbi:MAG: hypothetical protein AB1425_15980 [Actinomycetota bacterium]
MLNYPLKLGFKIAAIGTRVRVTDAGGRLVAYVRKKKFRIREDVRVYADENQNKELFRIRADRAWDFGARYEINAADGRRLGAVKRQGMRSLWKSTYEVTGPGGEEVATIHEENPMVKVLDGLAESIPGGDALGGLFFNPAYLVDAGDGTTLMRVQKGRSLFESRFTISRQADVSDTEEELLLASIIMMVLLERDRG